MQTVPKLVIALISTSLIFGQAPPKDVYGWGKLRWGITVAQAKALYGAQMHDSYSKDEEPNADYTERLAIDNFGIGDVKMKASVCIDPKSKLVKNVTLAPLDQQATTKDAAYYHLRDLLIQKYGRPTIEEKKEPEGETTVSSSVVWTLPSTVIRLYFIESPRINFSILRLAYTATDKKALGVL